MTFAAFIIGASLFGCGCWLAYCIGDDGEYRFRDLAASYILTTVGLSLIVRSMGVRFPWE